MTTKAFTPGLNEEQVRRSIRSGADFGVTAPTGGARKQVYWRPDGIRVIAVPNIREFVIKDDKGSVVSSGQRDANLDKGWLTTSPLNPKLHCQWCDTWHDTPAEVAACKKQYEQDKARREAAAKREFNKESKQKDDRIAELESKLNKVMKMLEAQSGAVLQSGNSQKPE